MEIVDEHTHRVLAYVDALNRHGMKPDPYWVDQFADAPEREVREESGLGVLALVASARSIQNMFGVHEIPSETFPEYMARLGWIRGLEAGAVELTRVGKALLKALNSPAIEDSSARVFEIVLDPANPFAYAQALGGLSTVRNALLVEPYFRLEQLIDISDFENITRVMLSSNLPKRDLDVLAAGLNSLSKDRPLEVRRAKDLHDRYLIPAGEGNVMMLGASLGGIGKKVSTMTTLGSVASQALRDAHEAIWASAEAVEPKKQPAASAAPPHDSAPATVLPPKKSPSKKAAPAKKSLAERRSAAKKSASEPGAPK